MSRRNGSCPDWRALVAARDEASTTGAPDDASRDAAWRQALAHLATCRGCRPAALAAEPTLLFQSLPRIDVTTDDLLAMRQAVAAMRRAERVSPEPRSGRLARVAAGVSGLGRRGRGLAAAGLLAAASGGLWLALPAPTPIGAPPTAVTESTQPVPIAEPAGPSLLPSAAEPVFMDLSSPRAADVYRVGRGGGLQVVMVVDETLDV